MEDFSAWLRSAANESDYVVLSMDLGAGREFQLLQRLVQDGTLPLVDKLYIRWRYQLSVRGSEPRALSMNANRSKPLKPLKSSTSTGATSCQYGA